MSQRLPISVVLPCRDNLDELPEHLERAADWLDRVEQVIVVDSSTDGTLDYLRREMTGAQVEFHSLPPGLYAAWNHGASCARAEFCYYSTVLDHCSFDDLEYLVRGIQETGTDVLAAPPEVFQADGVSASSERWPVHDFLQFFSQKDVDSGFFIPNRELLAVLACVLAPKAVLGSSASNLYKTATLKDYPWPLEFGHAGDAAWFLRWHPFVRIGYSARPVGTFCLNRPNSVTSGRDVEELSGRLRKEALLAATAPGSRGGNAAFLAGALHATDNWQQVLWKWIASQDQSADVVTKQNAYIASLETTRDALLKENERFRRSLPHRIAGVFDRMFARRGGLPFDGSPQG